MVFPSTIKRHVTVELYWEALASSLLSEEQVTVMVRLDYDVGEIQIQTRGYRGQACHRNEARCTEDDITPAVVVTGRQRFFFFFPLHRKNNHCSLWSDWCERVTAAIPRSESPNNYRQYPSFFQMHSSARITLPVAATTFQRGISRFTPSLSTEGLTIRSEMLCSSQGSLCSCIVSALDAAYLRT